MAAIMDLFESDTKKMSDNQISLKGLLIFSPSEVEKEIVSSEKSLKKLFIHLKALIKPLLMPFRSIRICLPLLIFDC